MGRGVGGQLRVYLWSCIDGTAPADSHYSASVVLPTKISYNTKHATKNKKKL